MEWRDKGFIIAMRRHGETSVIVEALTQRHGRHAGYVRGGARAKRLRGVLACGNQVHLVWRSRLEEHLGVFQVELDRAYAMRLMDDALVLDGLNALCALAGALPERQPMEKIFIAFADLVEAMLEAPKAYIWAMFARFELLLLDELGFGLDRADKEPLPFFLQDAHSKPSLEDIARGLRLTASLLEDRVYRPQGLSLPEARLKLAERFV